MSTMPCGTAGNWSLQDIFFLNPNAGADCTRQVTPVYLFVLGGSWTAALELHLEPGGNASRRGAETPRDIAAPKCA